MFSTVESLATNRANQRPVASSIMLINNIPSPRPSNQSWSLVSHCTSSPKRLRRGRHSWIFSTRCFPGRHSFALVIHSRTVSRLTSMPCFLPRYSEASVGPNPRYTGCDRMATASFSVSALIFRFDGGPRSPCATTLSPRRFSSRSRRRLCLSVIPSSSAACFLRDQFLLRLLQGHQAVPVRLVSSVVVLVPSPQPGWRQPDISTFAQIGHYHFALT